MNQLELGGAFPLREVPLGRTKEICTADRLRNLAISRAGESKTDGCFERESVAGRDKDRVQGAADGRRQKCLSERRDFRFLRGGEGSEGGLKLTAPQCSTRGCSPGLCGQCDTTGAGKASQSPCFRRTA